MTSVEWDFGDGASSTEQDPAHEYTVAGSYTVRLTVSGPGGRDVATLPEAVNVNPGPLAEVVVTHTQIALQVQDTARLGARALDRFANEISDVVFTWSTLTPAGRVDDTGMFTAGTAAGTYEGLVKVTATQGSKSKDALIGVTITPGPLSSVVVKPAEVALDIGATETFSFRAFDQFGNEISDVVGSWSIAQEVGTIDAKGVLTAGTKGWGTSGWRSRRCR